MRRYFDMACYIEIEKEIQSRLLNDRFSNKRFEKTGEKSDP